MLHQRNFPLLDTLILLLKPAKQKHRERHLGNTLGFIYFPFLPQLPHFFFQILVLQVKHILKSSSVELGKQEEEEGDSCTFRLPKSTRNTRHFIVI